MTSPSSSTRERQPSRLSLEQGEGAARATLEAAILHSSTLDTNDSIEVSDAARQLKQNSVIFESASRALNKWLTQHGHTAEAREVRRTRHTLVYMEAKESLADLNGLLVDMKIDKVSDIGAASNSSTVTKEDLDRDSSHSFNSVRSPRTTVNLPASSDFSVTQGSPTTRYSPNVIPEKVHPSFEARTVAANHFEGNNPGFRSTTTPFSLQSKNVANISNEQLINKVDITQRSVSWSIPEVSDRQEFSFERDIRPNRSTGLSLSHNETPFQLSNLDDPLHSGSRHNRSHISDFPAQTLGHKKPQYLERLDAQTRHLLRQELLKGCMDKFSGEPQQFSSWKNNLQRRLQECEADSLDSLHILLANSTDRPKAMIQHFLSAGVLDPETTLRDVWINLERRFATVERIADYLMSKISNTVPIKSSNDLIRLEDLLDLCRVILNNLVSCPELGIFNLKQGMRMIWDKLPETFVARWRSKYVRHEEETGLHPDFSLFLEQFEKFVIEVSHPSFLSHSKPFSRNVRTLATSSSSVNSSFCNYHKRSGHLTSDCNALGKLSDFDRKKFAVDNKLCFSCLECHFSKDCPDKQNIKCEKCQLNHCTLMHYNKRNNCSSQVVTNNVVSERPKVNDIRNSCTTLCGSESSSRVCSKTLPVQLTCKGSNKILKCLCIIDEQSNASFCDDEVVSFFNLTTSVAEYSLSTMTDSRVISGSLVSGLSVRGFGSRKWFSLPSLLTHPNLPNTKGEMASREIVAAHPHISHLATKFPSVDQSYEVMILIGVNAGELMRTKTFGAHFPFVHKTALGYALVGPSCIETMSKHSLSVKTLRSSVTSNEPEKSEFLFANKLSKFQLNSSSPFTQFPDDDLPGLSRDDIAFNDLMEKGIEVNERGNLQLPLPLREGIEFPDNRSAVFFRTKNTLDRLRKNPGKLQSCLDSFDAYLKEGHVEHVPDSFEKVSLCYHIPIFPVYEARKDKARLVFDSSAVFSGVSLNQALLQGPDLNNALVGVLIRFRLGEVAVTADIQRMFHAFYVDPKHIDLLRFFWFKDNDPCNEIVPFRALVHIFGNKPSPAIANFALRFTTLHPGASVLVKACSTIRNNFYVDDALFSTDSVSEAVSTLKDICSIFSRYNIRLHKILSSSGDVMRSFPASELASTADKIDIFPDEVEHRTLGIVWSPTSDELSLSPSIPSRPFTKRGILAVVNAVYDPIGLASPIVLTGRLLQRKMIPSKENNSSELQAIGWDDALPSRYQDDWDKWTRSLRGIGSIRLSRCYKPQEFGEVIRAEIHCFADASDEAIGFVSYLKQTNATGSVSISFLFANSRVAPRAANTVPRLELCASLEAVQTITKVVAELQTIVHGIYFYSDSKIVLGYIMNRQKRFSRYVTRRIEEILKHSNATQWRHIEGSMNVGDLASRPQSIKSLLNSDWLRGPSFLFNVDEEAAFEKDSVPLDVELPEVRCNTNIAADRCQLFKDSVYLRTTSWLRASLIVARVLKFVHLLKGCLSNSCNVCDLDLDKARLYLIKDAQSFFHNTIERIVAEKQPSPSDNLRSLNPFVDTDGILRVGGRLKDSSFPGDVKHPILLPTSHPVTLMILRHSHERVKHQGRFMTMGDIRVSGYHILNGSSVLKRYIRDCVICRRLRGKHAEQMMADLPPDRLAESPPFTNVGLDLFGPYLIYDGKSTRRTNANKKAWGLLVTCLVSRAVHIELLPYLDTTSLQLGLRRFYSIRGTCKRIRSDQGSNIIGLRSQLVDLNELREDARKLGVQWELIPPAASSWGGVWERKVGAVKSILECSLLQCGKSSLSRDELNTYLQECASIVNNTPLWECSSDPDDPAPISPANLLTLRDHPNPPSPESFTANDLTSYGKRRWRRIMFICDEFWVRWRNHYVQSLQARSKWQKRRANVCKGDVVLVKRNTKRNEWPVGRIISTREGRDGLVRSVTIQLPKNNSCRKSVLERSVRDIVIILSNQSANGSSSI